jgi:predicted ABC-type ATPase
MSIIESGVTFTQPNITIIDALKYWNTISKGKKPIKPRFYIKYGPPASGKSIIMDSVAKKDKINRADIISIDVDHIVKSNTAYQKDLAIIEKSSKSPDEKTRLKQLLYFSWRETKVRDKGFNKTLESVAGGDYVSEVVLENALSKKFNIDWETTGGSVNWTVREIRRIKTLGYTTVLVYPLVPLEQLLKRVKKRKSQTNAPDKQIISNSYAALTNMKYIVNEVDYVYIYDNSDTKGVTSAKQRIIVEIENKWDGGWGKQIDGALGLTRNITRGEKYNGKQLKKKFPKLFPYIENLFKSSNTTSVDISAISLITTINKLAITDKLLADWVKDSEKLHKLLSMTEELYNTLDENYDGKISEAEFTKWWENYQKEMNKGTPAAVKRSAARSLKRHKKEEQRRAIQIGGGVLRGNKTRKSKFKKYFN